MILAGSDPAPVSVFGELTKDHSFTMAISNIVSDLALTTAGCFALWLCTKSQKSVLVWSWGLFLVPLALAAFFGALRFAEVPRMHEVSSIFQLLAITLGSCGLLLAVYQLTLEKAVSVNGLIVCMLVGGMLFVLVWQGRGSYIRQLLPLVSMLLVAILAIVAIARKRWVVGMRLLAGVILAAAATWLAGSLDNRTLAIDAYHYLLGLSAISFGWAASQNRSSEAV
jgi:hypothetical protein